MTSDDPERDPPHKHRAHALMMRLGITLWIVSWVPVAAIFGWTGEARIATWIVQVVIGVIGLALAGREFAQIVKTVGWRRAPRIAGVALWRGSVPATNPPGPSPVPAPVPGAVPATPRPPSRR